MCTTAQQTALTFIVNVLDKKRGPLEVDVQIIRQTEMNVTVQCNNSKKEKSTSECCSSMKKLLR